MKSEFLMSFVVARKPAVLITPFGPISTPSRLIRKTWPLALSVPLMVEGPKPPITRLSATALAFGCTKVVVSPGPMLNVFQLMIARWVVWLTLTLGLPTPVNVADPPTTCGPSGPPAAGSDPSVKSAVEVSRMWRRRVDMFASSVAAGHDEIETPVLARSIDRLRDRKVGGETPVRIGRWLPAQADP